MKKQLLIFGTGQIAELAHFYFQAATAYHVAAFVVDAAYISSSEFCGLPVISPEEAVTKFPPEHCDFFVALSYSALNAVRKQKYLEAKSAGYGIASFVSPRATVLTREPIGENCFILEDNTIQPFARIGDNVTLWSGNHIGHHSRIGNHCFISSHTVVSGGVEIGEQCFLGVNATLRDHIRIGDRCVIGAGALILSDAEADGVYIGGATERSRVPSHRLRKI